MPASSNRRGSASSGTPVSRHGHGMQGGMVSGRRSSLPMYPYEAASGRSSGRRSSLPADPYQAAAGRQPVGYGDAYGTPPAASGRRATGKDYKAGREQPPYQKKDRRGSHERGVASKHPIDLLRQAQATGVGQQPQQFLTHGNQQHHTPEKQSGHHRQVGRNQQSKLQQMQQARRELRGGDESPGYGFAAGYGTPTNKSGTTSRSDHANVLQPQSRPQASPRGISQLVAESPIASKRRSQQPSYGEPSREDIKSGRRGSAAVPASKQRAHGVGDVRNKWAAGGGGSRRGSEATDNGSAPNSSAVQSRRGSFDHGSGTPDRSPHGQRRSAPSYAESPDRKQQRSGGRSTADGESPARRRLSTAKESPVRERERRGSAVSHASASNAQPSYESRDRSSAHPSYESRDRGDRRNPEYQQKGRGHERKSLPDYEMGRSNNRRGSNAGDHPSYENRRGSNATARSSQRSSVGYGSNPGAEYTGAQPPPSTVSSTAPKSQTMNATAIATCASAGHLPAGNKNGAGWLWVSYVLACPDGLREGSLALLKEQGWTQKQNQVEQDTVALMIAHKIVLRVHNIVGVPFSEDRALWANVKRDLQFKEFMVGVEALLKTIRASFQQFRVPSSVIVRRKKGNVWDNYDRIKQLGSGAFGDVYLARQKKSGREYVIKSLRLTNTNPKKDLELVHQFKAEFDVCRKLHHLNVVRVFEMYLDPYAIVMELARGGALFDFVESSNQVGVNSEEWIAGVIEQVLGAVSYCHDRGVAHQDLKPDNILLSAPVEQQRKGVFRSRLVVPSVVVSDFGQASLFGFSKDHGGGFKIGDPRYASPDAWCQKFSMGNDVWSVGVTLYELLSGGILPFLGQAVSLRKFADQNLWKKMKSAVCNAELQPDWGCLEGCSPEALDLLYWMLQKEEGTRPTAAQCLEHPWFALMRQRRGAQKLDQQERENFVVQMAHRAQMPKHERALTNVLLMNVENTRLLDARNLFEALDVEHSGFVSLEKLADYLVSVKLPSRTAKDLFSACGVVSTRNLEFDDFVLACWDPKNLEPQELNSLLLACFLRLDEERRGYLTRSSLRFIFPEAILADLWRATNPRPDTGILFDEFRDFFAGIMDREWAAQNDHSAVNTYFVDSDGNPTATNSNESSKKMLIEDVTDQENAKAAAAAAPAKVSFWRRIFCCASGRPDKQKKQRNSNKGTPYAKKKGPAATKGTVSSEKPRNKIALGINDKDRLQAKKDAEMGLKRSDSPPRNAYGVPVFEVTYGYDYGQAGGNAYGY